MVDALAQRADRQLELRNLARIKTSRREQRSVGFKSRCGRAARESHRPIEGPAREHRAAFLEQQRVLHEGSQAFFLGRTPFAAQPRRWRKAEVEKGHDREHDDLNRQLHDQVRRRRAGRDREHEDGHDAGEAKAQRPEPPGLHGGQGSRHEPEANDRLDH